MSTWAWIAWGVGILVSLYLLHRSALWLEREGWIRYIHYPPSAGDGGGAMFGELQKIYEPQTRHVYELKEQNRPMREAEAGDDPA